MTTRFDRDTALEQIDATTFAGRIDSGWWVERGPNGGYLAAIMMRAMAALVPDRPPRSLTVHFMSAPGEGRVEISAEVQRAGRSLATISGRMSQSGKPIALALASFSPPWPGPEYADAVMPDVPAPGRGDTSGFPPEGRPPIVEQFDYQWALGATIFSGADRAEIGAWLRLKEPAPLDPARLTLFCDAVAPSVFPRLTQFVSAPTIDLTVHYRSALPPAGAADDDFCLAVFRSRTAREGFFEEDGEIWSRDGTLLAQSRQLALLLPLGG